MSILVKSEKKHFELLWLVASKLITGNRATEDFIPGSTAYKIDEMPACAFGGRRDFGSRGDVVAVFGDPCGRGWRGRGRRGGCGGRCGGF